MTPALRPIARHRTRPARTGSALVAVLWCLALLFVLVIGVLHTARIDLVVTKHYGDKLQAHYLALAGVEKTKALIYRDMLQRSRAARSYGTELLNAPELFRKAPFGRGEFTVFRRASPADGGGLMYGVADEESRLNVNYASAGELANLYAITPDVVAAIIDWRDRDNAPSPGGAEQEYYLSLSPPRQPRNGPFETTRELLMVRGVSRDLLLGKDLQQNGMIEDLDAPVTSLANPLELGWASMLTAHSGVQNVNSAGTERLNIQTADEAALTRLPGINADLAKAIVRYRAQKRFETIFDLLDVSAPQDETQAAASRTLVQSGRRPVAPNSPAPGQPGGEPQPGFSGPKLVSPTLLMDIADDITAQNDQALDGVLNVNSAGLEALACLPNVSREMAQAVISFRQSNGYLPNIAWLLKVPGFTPELLKQLAPRVTTRSETYRILCEGRVLSTGVRQRIEEIVHIGFDGVTTLASREVDL